MKAIKKDYNQKLSELRNHLSIYGKIFPYNPSCPTCKKISTEMGEFESYLKSKQ